MVENDIYNSKRAYDRFKANLNDMLKKPNNSGRKGCRKYYIKNKVNLKYFERLMDTFEVRDNTYVRRLKLLGTLKVVTYVLDKDLKDCCREDIDRVVAFSHTVNKSIESKTGFIRSLKFIWRDLFPELDEKGRADETVFPYAVRHLSNKVDKSRQKLRNDRITFEEFDKLVNYFSDDVIMKAYLTLALESLGRPQEILYRKFKDLQLFENYAKIYISEHGKEGTGFLISIDSFPYLSEMIRKHPHRDDPEAYLFLNGFRKQLKPNTLNKKISSAMKGLGISKSVTCYSLKRNGVTFRRLRGDSDVEIQHVARWTTTKQLHTYDMSNQEDALKTELAKRGMLKDENYKKHFPKSKTCGFCGELNGFTEEYCIKCKRVVDTEKLKKSIYEEVTVTKRLKEFNRVLVKEHPEIVGKVMGQLGLT